MGEKLSRAPVFFTIVQVRFNPILQLDQFLPAIQDAFRRAGYPDLEERKINNLQIEPEHVVGGTPPKIIQAPQFLFASMDRLSEFILNQDALSFQTTNYQTFMDFLPRFSQGLSIVNKEISLAYTGRIGLRYVNAVVPGRDEILDSYINPRMLGLGAPQEGEMVQSFTETLLRQPPVSILTRVVIHRGRVGLPPDLQPVRLPLKAPLRGIIAHHAILDVDGYVEERAPFDLDDVRERLARVHDCVEIAFHAAVTDHARKAWT